MLQNTCTRLDGLNCKPPLLICGEDHRFIVAEQLRSAEISPSKILLEPEGRNTAPAIALAALHLAEYDTSNDPLLLILAADHSIKDLDSFRGSISSAAKFASQGHLVTFGVVPSSPETGYGYIECGGVVGDGPAQNVVSFVEKPSLDTAEEYLAAGNYLWNSGMFLFRASRFLEELERYRPDILKICNKAMRTADVDAEFIRPNREVFLNCPEESVDYAVMERTSSAVVVPMNCHWSDVGSWSALWDVSDKDGQRNTIKGDVVTIDTQGSYIQSEKKLIAAVGLQNVVIVESDDAIMVADMSKVQQVKNVVSLLRAKNRTETQTHRKVFRPWGYYDSIEYGERFQVKRILVKPGACLSLQMHHHRAEHWVVVKGTAKVTNGDKEFLLSENESTFIPIGEIHRLENPGAIPLEMIEVQSGSYLGEDDIVRFDDRYDRK